MAKYKVGDKVFIQVEIVGAYDGAPRPYEISMESGGYRTRIWVTENSIVDLTPAPLAPARWTPKKGERVLVEAVFDFVDLNYDFILRMENGYCAHRKDVYPVPVKPARFKVGDVVVYRPMAEACKVICDHGNGEYDVLGSGTVITADEGELIDRSEAIERLAK